MMEEQNSAGKGRTIGYIAYAVLCIVCSYAASALKMEIDQWRSRTFQTFPSVPLVFVLYVVLGLLWAGERILAGKADRTVLVAVRCGVIAVLALLCIGWCIEMFILGSSSAVLTFTVYASGTMPVLALLTGYLTVDTIRLLTAKS